MRFDIEKVGGKVLMSVETYENILDILAYDRAKARKRELFPLEVLDAMLAGESPVKVFRKHRGLTQEALGKRAGLTKVTISEIENGRKNGSVESLSRIAEALGVEIGDLV